MSKEYWNEITEQIDERYTDEAAEYFAKHNTEAPIVEISGEGKAISLKPAEKKKQGKGKIIGLVCAAAAAVVLCVFGGIKLLQNRDALLPDDTSVTDTNTPDTEGALAKLVLSETAYKQFMITQRGFLFNPEFSQAEQEFMASDDYKAARSYVNSLPDSDEKQKLIDELYLETDLQMCYIGDIQSNTDWLACMNYRPCYSENGTETICYTALFLVSDGYISMVDEFIGYGADIYCEDGRYYVDRNGSGLYVYELAEIIRKEDAEVITEENVKFFDANSRCVVYINNNTSTLQVHLRQSGKVTDTGAVMSETAQTRVKLLPDRLRYTDSNNQVCDLMLADGSIVWTKLDYRSEFADDIFAENDRYIVSAPDTENQRIIVTYKQSGKTLSVEFKNLHADFYTEKSEELMNTALCGDMLYIPLAKEENGRQYYAAYDLQSGEVLYFDADHVGTLYEDNGYTINKAYVGDDCEYSVVSLDTETPYDWAHMTSYGDYDSDKAALEFAESFSESAQKAQQDFYDDFLKAVAELDPEYLDAYKHQIEDGSFEFEARHCYVRADEGEFWLKGYFPQNSAYFPDDFEYFELYFRSGDEFRLIHSLDDLNYDTELLVTNGDYLYYLRDEGVIERISPSSEVELVYDGRLELPVNGDGQKLVPEYGFSGNRDRLNVTLTFECAFNNGIWARKITEYVLDTDNRLIDSSITDYGYYFADGVAIPFSTAGSGHGHNDASQLSDALMKLGRHKLEDAARLYAIKEQVAEVKPDVAHLTIDGYSEIAGFDNPSTVDGWGSYHMVEELYSSTFAPVMSNYGGWVYSKSAPANIPWYTDPLNNTLRGDITEQIRRDESGNAYIRPQESEPRELWTIVCGVTKSGDDYVEYQLCTICTGDEEQTYIFEHSTMRLEKISGEWVITQLRSRLGNEYGTKYRDQLIEDGFTYLKDEPTSAVGVHCGLLEQDGFTILGTAIEDFDRDQTTELFILAEKNGENSIYVYEQRNYAWERVEIIFDDELAALNSLHFVWHEDRWRAKGTNGEVIGLYFETSNSQYDENGGKFIAENLGNGQPYVTISEHTAVAEIWDEGYEEYALEPQTAAERLASKFVGNIRESDSCGFTVNSFDIVDVSITPVSEADESCSITDWERGLSDAWIVDIAAIYSDESGQHTYDSGSTGFLMWKCGGTYLLRSRWHNGGTVQNITEAQLKAWLDENLTPAEEILRTVYFSGKNAWHDGAEQFDTFEAYYLPADFPYKNAEEIRTEMLKYFTQEAVDSIDVDYWIFEQDGRLCARVFNKGLGIADYRGSETAEIVMQYGNKVLFSLGVSDSPMAEVAEIHSVIAIENVGGEWRFAEAII